MRFGKCAEGWQLWREGVRSFKLEVDRRSCAKRERDFEARRRQKLSDKSVAEQEMMMRRALLYMQNRQLALGLGKWRTVTAHLAHEANEADRRAALLLEEAARRLEEEARRCEEEERCETEARVAKEKLENDAKRAIQRWIHRQMWSCWNMWRDWAETMKRQKDTMQRAVRRMMHRQLTLAYLQWRSCAIALKDNATHEATKEKRRREAEAKRIAREEDDQRALEEKARRKAELETRLFQEEEERQKARIKAAEEASAAARLQAQEDCRLNEARLAQERVDDDEILRRMREKKWEAEMAERTARERESRDAKKNAEKEAKRKADIYAATEARERAERAAALEAADAKRTLDARENTLARGEMEDKEWHAASSKREAIRANVRAGGGASARSSPHRSTCGSPLSVVPVVTQVAAKHTSLQSKRVEFANGYVQASPLGEEEDQGIKPWHAQSTWHIGLSSQGAHGEIEKGATKEGTGRLGAKRHVPPGFRAQTRSMVVTAGNFAS